MRGDDDVGGAARQRRVPKYYRVKQELLALIADAEPGTNLPPERTLSERFETSRTTVRQALAELVAEGRVGRVQGSGTFVLPPKLAIPLALVSHTTSMQERGIEPGSRQVQLASVAADDDVARQLRVAAGERVVALTRVRLGDGQPMAIETMHLPAARFPGVRRRIRSTSSMYAMLAEHYEVVLAGATQTVETALADPTEAALLETDVGAPLLMLTRTSWTADDRRVEFTRSLYRGDRYRLVADVVPPSGDGALAVADDGGRGSA